MRELGKHPWLEPEYLYPAVFLLATVVVYILPSGRAILDDGDALYAHISAQMLVRGDWITPYANGVRFLDKPPLMFWLMAVSYKFFGVHEWAARLPTAIGIAGTAWLLWSMARRASGAIAGLVAALGFVLATGTLFFTLEAFPDIFLVFFLTLSIYFLLNWYRTEESNLWASVGFGLAVGGAALAKSLIGILFPLGIAALFLTVSKGWRRIKVHHVVIAVAVGAAIALPWHVVVGARNPGFYEHYFINEQVLRFLGRRQPVDYGSISIPIFWVLILLWFFPWSLFLPGTLCLRRATSGNREADALAVASICGAALVLTFFTFSSRLEHYSFPMIPPLALLVGMSIGKGGEFTEKWFSRGLRLLAALGVLSLISALGVTVWWRMRGEYLNGTNVESRAGAYSNLFSPLFELPPATRVGLVVPLIFALTMFGCGMLLAWWLNRKGKRPGAILALAAMMVGFCLTAVHSLGLSEGLLSSKPFGIALQKAAAARDRVVILGDFESANSINFYSPVQLMVLGGKADSIEGGLRYPDAPKVIVSRDYLEAVWHGPERTFLLGRESQIAAIGIAPSFAILDYAGRRLVSNQPVALRH